MIRHRYCFVSLVALVIILSAATPPAVSQSSQNLEAQVAAIEAQLAEPTLVKAELFTHTNRDNKDKDTGIYVTVTTQDTNVLLTRFGNY